MGEGHSLFNCNAISSNHWKYIVIHHSATNQGSTSAFHRSHTMLGYGGVAYHFVVGNGQGMKDGEVESTFRWKNQTIGTHVSVKSWEYNIHGIGICLVGNFEKKKPTSKQRNSLIQLIVKLMKDHNISSDNIIFHNQVPFDANPKKSQQTLCPGKHLSRKKILEEINEKFN